MLSPPVFLPATGAVRRGAHTQHPQSAVQALGRDHASRERAQPARHGLCFHRDTAAEGTEKLRHIGHRIRIEARHDTDARFNAAARQFLGGRDRFHRDRAHRKNGHVPAVSDDLKPTGLEVSVQVLNGNAVALPEAVVNRAGHERGRAQRRRGLLAVGRRDDHQPRQCPQHADIFQRVVCRSGVAILESHSHADHAHRKPVQHRAIANKLKRAQRGEGRNGINIRQIPRFRQTGSETDHILFGHAGIQKPVGEALPKRLEHHVAQISGQQKNALIRGREIHQCLNKCLSHRASPSSFSARSNSNWLMGR